MKVFLFILVSLVIGAGVAWFIFKPSMPENISSMIPQISIGGQHGASSGRKAESSRSGARKRLPGTSAASITIANNSDCDIQYLYIAKSSRNEWGEDRLSDSEGIKQGSAKYIPKIAPDKYDIIVSAIVVDPVNLDTVYSDCEKDNISIESGENYVFDVNKLVERSK